MYICNTVGTALLDAVSLFRSVATFPPEEVRVQRQLSRCTNYGRVHSVTAGIGHTPTRTSSEGLTVMGTVI